MIYDGKTYRNLESQVGYLTDIIAQLDARITEVAAQIPSKMIVAELPEEGNPLVTYYVGPKGTSPNFYYEVWVWVQEVEDGPFVWRELEDTDQVDLSGYLEKNTSTTVYPKVYVKWANGTQGTENLTDQAEYNAVVRRTATGQVNVPQTPTENNNATSKKYVDDNFLAKQTGVTSADQVYGKGAGGTQVMYDIGQNNAAANSIVRRTAQGRVIIEPPNSDYHAVNLKYANDHYLAKQTGTSTYQQAYTKKADGTQDMLNVATYEAAYTVPVRTVNGTVRTDTPQNGKDAANKDYVDAVVGQLIYHHDMVIRYDDGADYVKIAAHSDNNTSTAFTSIDWHNMPLLMPDYAMYYYNGNEYLASVTKLPYALHQDEFSEPRDGFLLTYWDGGAYQNVRVNSSIFNTPTVTDAVTTW